MSEVWAQGQDEDNLMMGILLTAQETPSDLAPWCTGQQPSGPQNTQKGALACGEGS